jgi:hypothetical protein
MEWDELCVLSGIGPEGGPYRLFEKSQLHEVVSAIATDIHKLASIDTASPSISKSDLEYIIQKALPHPFQDHIRQWPGSQTCIAIGHFDRHGDFPKGWVTEKQTEERTVENARILSGDDVQVRSVNSWENGAFHVTVVRLPNGELEQQQQRSDCNCRMHDSMSNFFVLEGCWMYLQAWLDVSSQPILSSHSGKPLSLAGEFYEIINSRQEKRRCTYRSRTSVLSPPY